MKANRKFIFTVAAAGVAAGISACGGSPAPVDAAQACAALAGQTVAGATASAALVAASGPVPGYCNISATIAPALNFEMRIPNNWNGKLHYGGGGGFDGVIQKIYDAAGGGGTDADNHGLNLAALSKGYINISSDSGHQGKIPGYEAIDASWFPGNPTAQRLYADLAVPSVMAAAVEMIKKVYGSAPGKSYFEGCSNGGREALMTAQRYPTLFDGIIARAPASNFVASLGSFQNNMRMVATNPSLNFTAAKVRLLSKAVLAACDGLDGVVDGIVSNPAACTFDAASARSTLRCTGGADTGDSCLSDAQLAVVDTWTASKTFAGKYTTPGWALTGNESALNNWDAWLFGGFQFAFQYGGIAGIIQQDAKTQPLPPQDASALDTLAFDFDAPANAAALNAIAAAFDASNPDLRPFMNNGRKLLLWHGGADPALSSKNTTGYYQSVVATVGGQAAADAFARYYIAPGVNHCHGGVGADKSDLLTALDAWVSNGTAPSGLTASKLAGDGSAAFSRPLCAYPLYARYTGPANDANAARLASNYACTSP
ncbi:MAG: tannase/feruloyl esterase family alpha/beta hydrolase [Burkholderiales bacterium]|nr:tannase/feruloyl esterase family alpha/beta hydrolase [Burkholderiales bacterium]